MKALFQLIIFVALFFAIWLGLSAINWMNVLHIKQNTELVERKLGSIIWKAYGASEREIKGTASNTLLQRVVNHLATANNIDTADIKLHLVDKNEINAFTLPDGHIIVYTGLIASCKNEAELFGVLGHEMAHMKNNHVMKKMTEEIGLSVLVTVASGKGGSETTRRIMKMISSTAFSRDLEKEADIASVNYMINAHIDPEPFANFLYRLSDRSKDLPNQLKWISTHPDSKERAAYIVEYIKTLPHNNRPFLTEAEWQELTNNAATDAESE